jgi:hypothetical protein
VHYSLKRWPALTGFLDDSLAPGERGVTLLIAPDQR